MKKMFKFMKAVTLMLMAVTMLLGADTITANAQAIVSGCMTVAEDGRIKVTCSCLEQMTDTKTGKIWYHTNTGRPFTFYNEKVEIQKPGRVVVTTVQYFDCYLSDYVKTHDESEWPDFVIKGNDGIPFYYSETNNDWSNKEKSSREDTSYFYIVRYCYDEASDEWLYDKSYKGPFCRGYGVGPNIEVGGVKYKTVTLKEYTEQTKADIANGKEVKGKAGSPEKNPYDDGEKLVDSETGEPIRPSNPTTPSVPTEGGEITDPYADENTLGATVTLKTDCIKVKTNKKGVVAQKPLPKAVKVGTKALKRNKTFVVSYEKYENGWYATDAVTDEGIYRLVITGQNGYEGVYKKRLYVTADKTIKAMSSVAVKVNKVPYSGEPITSSVIKSVKVGRRVLEEGTDYTVTYKNNLDSGTGQVTLTAIEGSGVLGTKTVNFTITGNKMNKVKVTGLKALVYDPNVQMVQNMSDIQLTYAGSQLVEGIDFTFAYTNNVKAGTAKITFTGKGLYNGTLNKTFKITKLPLNDGMLDEASRNIKLTYTKKALKPEVKLTVGGIELKKGTDYTLAYSNNVKVSTETKPAWITVKGKGSYSGSFKVSFTIVPEGDDTAAKPNTASILSAKEVPDEDDTVSGNSVENETPGTDDTVSRNDIADDTVSENDAIDDTDKTDEGETTDDADKTDEGETTDDADKTDEGETTDDADETDEDEITDAADKADEDGIIDERDNESADDESGDDESNDDEFKGEESTEPVVSATKPIEFVMCDCECIMPIYTYGWSDEEKTTWYEHLHEHERNGLQAHYNSVSYEKALKYDIIAEDENGQWSLSEGILLMLSGSESEESETEVETKTTEDSKTEPTTEVETLERF